MTETNLVSWEADRNAWCREQAAVLRRSGAALETAGLDWEKIAEELDALSRSDRRELESRLQVLMAHLLKWLFGGVLFEQNANDWRLTILEQRRQVVSIVKESPSTAIQRFAPPCGSTVSEPLNLSSTSKILTLYDCSAIQTPTPGNQVSAPSH